MKRKAFIPIMALAWLAAAVIIYFAGHKPFSIGTAISLARAAGQFLAAFAVLTVSGGLGHLALARLTYRPATNLALQAGLGLGIAATSWLMIGSTLGITPVIGWSMLILSILLLRVHIRSWLQGWSDLITLWQQSSRFGRILAAGTALILAFTLATALAPPLKWDALVYHLTIPRLYLNAGRVIYIPEIAYWGMPQVGEMLYAWAMSLAGAEAAVVLGWMGGALALTGMLGFISERLNPLAAWVGVASLLSGFTFAASLAWAYVDWFTLLFGWGFLVALDQWRSERKDRFLLLMGYFAGVALGTKYTAGILMIIGGLAVLWYARRRLGVKRHLAALMKFGSCATLVSLPWWIKNYLATGNPFYPFIFPAGAVDEFRLHWYVGGAAWGDWRDAFLLPFRATFSGYDFGPGYNASIGPLLLGLGSMGFLAWKHLREEHRKVTGTALLVAAIGVLIWSIAGRYSGFLLQTRLYFSIFPAIALLCGAGFLVFRNNPIPAVRFEFLAGALIMMVFGFNVFQIGVFTLDQGAPQTLLGVQSRETYISNNMGWYEPAMREIRDLPSDSKVLMLWESRSLYCQPKCTPDDLIDRWPSERQVLSDPQKILEGWQRAGYTHLLYYRLGDEFLRSEEPRYQSIDWVGLDVLLSTLPAPTNFGDTYELYRLSR